ncbi:MAG: GH116 family glycosyl-hydrolase, partial [Eubacteriales bacterium]|nr:GH116 family glycosyl-hydrolase [Eubacteriales bacterium]
MNHQANVSIVKKGNSSDPGYPAHTYKGIKTNAISFPLGGLGTGCIGLSGSGRLAEWEIFNRPNKGGVNGFSHFAVKAECGGKVLDTRVLNSDLPQSSYQGGNSGHGPGRTAMAGMPHFRSAEFTGTYPLACIRFIEPDFPGRITMKAFNPFIPLDDKNSGIPAAFFELEAENPTEQNIAYTFYLSVSNPSLKPCAANRFIESGGKRMITLSSGIPDKDNPEWGEITFATGSASSNPAGAEADAKCSATINPAVTGTAVKSYSSADHIGTLCQEYWYRGNWFDSLGCYWRDISAAAPLKDRSYPEETDPAKKPKPAGRNDTATLAAVVGAAPGQSAKARFIISWNYPNFVNYWDPGKRDPDKSKPLMWKNYYARLFHSSEESALYGLDNWDFLYQKTRDFRDALFSSTLPPEALDAVSANISILKTPTCLRLEDGSFYAFEGCNSNSGCCPGSCAHVWNYAYALPFLFPKLERSMRDLDYMYNQREDGSMSFRLRLPPGCERSPFRACADGQFGGVIKVYREWKISGDDDWLRGKWEAVRKSLDFAWAPSNEDHWDKDRDGVLEGRQHHTLDMELFGPNTWLTGMYRAALKAGSEVDVFLGEKEKAAEYKRLFSKGCDWTEKNLFNGEYYHQKIDLSDRFILSRYTTGSTLHGESAFDAYWNEEAGEIKYQIGEGCIIDQVLAQWHANLCGLGSIFDKGHVRRAL